MNEVQENLAQQGNIQSLCSALRTRLFVQKAPSMGYDLPLDSAEHADSPLDSVILLVALALNFVAERNNLNPDDMVSNLTLKMTHDDFSEYELDPEALRGRIVREEINGIDFFTINIPSGISEAVFRGDDRYFPLLLMVYTHELEHLAQHLKDKFRNNPYEMRFGEEALTRLAGYDDSITDFRESELNAHYHTLIRYWGYYLYFNSPAELGANKCMLEMIDYMLVNYTEIIGTEPVKYKLPEDFIDQLIERKEGVAEIISNGKSIKYLTEAFLDFLYLIEHIYGFDSSNQGSPNEVQSLIRLHSYLSDPFNPSIMNIPQKDKEKIYKFAERIQWLLSLAGVQTL